ncbi:general secretion pathway protein I [Endozoicomonas sp. NE40]|uniref:Type II secretion system protein I n=1 Tax=Endozoicomonas lisbonensis TaxID=3120522 RepID=A0ABV2SCF7_9GAMM
MDCRILRLPADHSRGFTLIEVMVALAVFAVAAAMLMLSDGNSIRQTRYMQEKVLAAQVADHYMSRLQAEKEWPDKGVKGKNDTYAGYDWYIRQVTRTTSFPDFRKVVVEVFIGRAKPEDDETGLYSLTSYFRKPKK